jgi:hypothetical protein
LNALNLSKNIIWAAQPQGSGFGTGDIDRTGTDLKTLKNEFYAGHYQQVLDSTVDAASSNWHHSDVPVIIGSLCFVGRLDEATVLARNLTAKLSVAEQIESRFYLAISLCRHNRGADSRKLLIENIRALRSQGDECDPMLEFFCWQGVAFYRYIGGRLKRALYWARLAYESAFLQRFTYGKVLALDILGHSQIRTDNVRAGFQSLKMAEKLCDDLGHGTNLVAIRAAICLYRSYYGLSGAEDLAEIDAQIEASQNGDSYTTATLLIEKSRILIWRGRSDEAKQMLNIACQLVYQVQNPVLEADLNLALAMWQYRRGELAQALVMIQSAIQRVGDTNDLITALRCRGFELNLLHQLNYPQDKIDAHRRLVESMTIKSGASVATRILNRLSKSSRNEMKSNFSQMTGQDPMGDVLDLVASGQTGAIREVLGMGFYGLLYDCLKLKPDFLGIVFGIEHSSVSIFDRGNVEHNSSAWPQLIVRLLMCLSQGPQEREAIVKYVWDQKYNPLRHDPVLYALVSRTRKLLGSKDRWLEVTEDGYALAREIKIIVHGNFAPPAMEETAQNGAFMTVQPIPKMPASKQTPDLRVLNLRQQKILELLTANHAISTRMICEALQTTEITASRDLASLAKLGYIVRQGKGRAVIYTRNDRNDS